MRWSTGPLPLALRQLGRLPPGLQNFQGGQQPQLHAILQFHAVCARQNRPRHYHTPVSMRLEATMVTFSTTMAPRVPASLMLLHWQSE